MGRKRKPQAQQAAQGDEIGLAAAPSSYAVAHAPLPGADPSEGRKVDPGSRHRLAELPTDVLSIILMQSKDEPCAIFRGWNSWRPQMSRGAATIGGCVARQAMCRKGRLPVDAGRL